MVWGLDSCLLTESLGFFFFLLSVSCRFVLSISIGVRALHSSPKPQFPHL